MAPIDSSATRCDLALARGVLYRFASRSFRHPDPAWRAEWGYWSRGIREAVEACCEEDGSSPVLREALETALACDLDTMDVVAEHARVLGHTPRASATPYETEWSGAAGDLLQFHQIADIAAFYNAFGLELGQGCDERADHVSVELEFLHFLCVKEAWAEEQGREDLAVVCRETQRKFLAEHVATWTPGLCARVEAASRGGFYGRVSLLLRLWIEDECRRLGAQPDAASLEPSSTSFRPEDACISCGHAAGCLSDLRGATRHVDDPLRT
jgi:TorA maturation chaperone TorD